MKRKELTWKIPMNIQIFAEGDGAGTDAGNGGGADDSGQNGDGSESGNEDGVDKPLSFDEWLASNKEYQAEFDRRTQKALGTQRDKLEVLYSEKTTEAEKLAKMTKEEKAQYLQQKQEKELTKREADITKRELMAEAKNTLAEKKLPVGLAEVLNYADADACGKSIAAMEKAFHQAVEDAVQDKLKGSTPPKRVPENAGKNLEKQIESIMMGR